MLSHFEFISNEENKGNIKPLFEGILTTINEAEEWNRFKTELLSFSKKESIQTLLNKMDEHIDDDPNQKIILLLQWLLNVRIIEECDINNTKNLIFTSNIWTDHLKIDPSSELIKLKTELKNLKKVIPLTADEVKKEERRLEALEQRKTLEKMKQIKSRKKTFLQTTEEDEELKKYKCKHKDYDENEYESSYISRTTAESLLNFSNATETKHTPKKNRPIGNRSLFQKPKGASKLNVRNDQTSGFKSKKS